ncbi:MAG: hypothetical protein JWR85_4227 [Marmoricola sp.]|nr:hypothetical protein [Marmoricola sp.]
MAKPNGTRKDLQFSRDIVLATLPGHAAGIAKRSGFATQTVLRALTYWIGIGKAYQIGWVKASRYVPTYAAGQPLPGWKLPPIPDAKPLKAARLNRYKKKKRATNADYRAKENARAAKRRAAYSPERIEAERQRKAASYQAQKLKPKPTGWGNVFIHLIKDE